MSYISYLEDGKWEKRRKRERRKGRREEDLSQSDRGRQAGSGSQVASVFWPVK